MGFSSDLLAAGAELGEHGLDAVLVDGAQRVRRHLEPHPALLRRHPEAALVQVGAPTALGLVVRVGHVVAGHHAFSGHLADFRHWDTSRSVTPLARTTSAPRRE